MKIVKLNCIACGAPITVPNDIDIINCASCGTTLGIQRGEGYIAFKAMEKIAESIHLTGKGTQDAIREGAQVTRAELQRLQLGQEVSMLEMKLAGIQGEIRALSRNTQDRRASAQLQDLNYSAAAALFRIRQLKENIHKLGAPDVSALIEYLTAQIGNTNAELAYLSHANLKRPHVRQAWDRVQSAKHMLENELLVEKAKILRKKYKSLQLQVREDNQEDVRQILSQCDRDLLDIRKQLRTPDVIQVENELNNLRNKYTSIWNGLEEQRIKNALRSFQTHLVASNLEEERNLLELVQADITFLTNQESNQVVKNYTYLLRNKKKIVEKSIRKYEKEARKAEQRAMKEAGQGSIGREEGFFAGLGIGALFSGVILSLKNIFGRSTLELEVPLPETDGQGEANGTLPAEASQVTNKPFRIPWKRSGLGCLIGLVSLFASLILAFIFDSIFFSRSDSEASRARTSLTLFLIALGYSIGSLYLLRMLIPHAAIRGLEHSRLFKKLRRQPAEEGIYHRGFARLLVGILVWIATYLFFLSFVMILGTTAGAIVALLALIIGPALGIFAASRTYLLPEDAALD